MITTGDCLEVMAQMPANSVDAIVTDPPYGLEFMGKEWDRLWNADTPTTASEPRSSTASSATDALGASKSWGRNEKRWQVRPKGGSDPFDTHRPRFGTDSRAMQEWHQRWATEALRVAKPGAYLLAFGGTRTYHRLAVAIEDAGWIIRDCLVWAYATGFPKSKALLKPAWEPIVMARKPGPLRELAIDACRIGFDGRDKCDHPCHTGQHDTEGPTVLHLLHEPCPKNHSVPPTARKKSVIKPGTIGYLRDDNPMFGGEGHTAGRWPANVILTDPIFDGNSEGVVGGGESSGIGGAFDPSPSTASSAVFTNHGPGVRKNGIHHNDTGTYSRFFLIPKAARSEREPKVGRTDERINTHPTVKPLVLMRHLVRLVTPKNGLVLDPFLGSGTTALAAEAEGFEWIGIEREAEYVAIANARLVKPSRVAAPALAPLTFGFEDQK